MRPCLLSGPSPAPGSARRGPCPGAHPTASLSLEPWPVACPWNVFLASDTGQTQRASEKLSHLQFPGPRPSKRGAHRPGARRGQEPWVKKGLFPRAVWTLPCARSACTLSTPLGAEAAPGAGSKHDPCPYCTEGPETTWVGLSKPGHKPRPPPRARAPSLHASCLPPLVLPGSCPSSQMTSVSRGPRLGDVSCPGWVHRVG